MSHIIFYKIYSNTEEYNTLSIPLTHLPLYSHGKAIQLKSERTCHSIQKTISLGMFIDLLIVHSARLIRSCPSAYCNICRSCPRFDPAGGRRTFRRSSPSCPVDRSDGCRLQRCPANGSGNWEKPSHPVRRRRQLRYR